MRIVNVAELAAPGWRFVADELPGELDWRFYDARPCNAIERRVRRPNLARYRAAFQAARAARSGDVLLSHMPIMTIAAADLARRIGHRPRHLAVSFNYTELPQGARLAHAKRALQGVERFLVYSRAEQALYPALFDLDPARFDFTPWPMARPVAGVRPEMLPADYVIAAGGEARDHATLLAAARLIPQIPVVIATRPGRVARDALPANVALLENLPGDAFWSAIAQARLSLVPLRDGETNCGHITIVGSQLLGTPIVATRSAGIADYVRDRQDGVLVPPRDPAALAEAIDRLWHDEATRTRYAAAALTFAERDCAPAAMAERIRRFIERAPPLG